MVADAGRKLTMDDIRAAADRLKNWGRWGPEDELGTLNHTRPEDVAAAARCVRTGRVLSLALPAALNVTLFSVLDALVLRPLQYPAADRLILLRPALKTAAVDAWRERSHTCDAFRTPCEESDTIRSNPN